MRRRARLFVLLLATGCSDPVVTRASPSGSAGSVPAAAASAATAKSAAPPVEEAPKAEIKESDFNESDKSRDPFRSFVSMFADETKSKVKTQREVLLGDYSLDELKLVGIVTRIQPERALIVDPTGKGHIVSRGNFIGRAEVVQGGTTGTDYEINWRVERIRDTDIVLVRDDPGNPDVPSTTRIIPLRTDSPDKQSQ